MGVGDDVPIGGHDDAGTHAGVLALVRHHQHRGGVHLCVDILNGQLLAAGLLTDEGHARLSLDTGDGGLFRLENIHDAAGVAVAVPVAVQRRRLAAALRQRPDDPCGHRQHQYAHGDEEYPQSLPAPFSGRRGRGTGGHGAGLHVVVHHLASLGADVPLYDLPRLLCQLFSVFILHTVLPLCAAQRAICMVNVKAVTPFSLVTVIFSLCWVRMVLTMYSPRP